MSDQKDVFYQVKAKKAYLFSEKIRCKFYNQTVWHYSPPYGSEDDRWSHCLREPVRAQSDGTALLAVGAQPGTAAL